MPKYLVRVFSPTVFEIEASSTQEAEQEAVKRYTKNVRDGWDTWIEPEVEVSEIK